MTDLLKIQKKLEEEGIDGWLLFDHHGSNKFVREIAPFPDKTLLTRRFFYWIPKKGEAVAILHRIEGESFPGKKRLYLSRIELEDSLATLLQGAKRVAMEYSPRNANPYVSVVDAGIVELVREKGVEVVSSASLLQYFMSVLDEKQIETHVVAAEVLERTVMRAWDFITTSVNTGKRITEYDVQQLMLGEFEAQGCMTEDVPFCAVGKHSALPHYQPTKEGSQEIRKGDFVLLDLWCKQKAPHSVYADITRVGVVAPEPPPRVQEVFTCVFEAQRQATEFLFRNFGKREICGWEVDDVCRRVIVERGFGEYFTHRTGHSIDTSVHGSGAHLDNFETRDERKLLKGSCFSVEPGIYLPGEFGVRLEYDILIGHDGGVRVTGGQQEAILCLD